MATRLADGPADIRGAPSLSDQARQVADDRSPSPGTATRPYPERPDNPGRY